ELLRRAGERYRFFELYLQAGEAFYQGHMCQDARTQLRKFLDRKPPEGVDKAQRLFDDCGDTLLADRLRGQFDERERRTALADGEAAYARRRSAALDSVLKLARQQAESARRDAAALQELPG